MEDNKQRKEAEKQFFEKREMNANLNDKDNAGDDTFTPIYLNSDTVLQTPGEKKHDESVNPQKGDKMEAMDTDNQETTIDKLNDTERDSADSY